LNTLEVKFQGNKLLISVVSRLMDNLLQTNFV
jgi:hypothetical protein